MSEGVQRISVSNRSALFVATSQSPLNQLLSLHIKSTPKVGRPSSLSVEQMNQKNATLRCRERLGGLLKNYYRHTRTDFDEAQCSKPGRENSRFSRARA